MFKLESRLVRVSSMLTASTKFAGKALHHLGKAFELGKACCLVHVMAMSILN